MKTTLTITKELDFQTEDLGVVASMTLTTEAGSYAQLELFREEDAMDEVMWGAQLSHLYVPMGARRQGEARALVKAAMIEVMERWDERTLVAFAEPEHDEPMTRGQLITFYQDCGLEVR